MNKLEICTKCVYKSLAKLKKERDIEESTFKKSNKEDVDPNSSKGAAFEFKYKDGYGGSIMEINPKLHCADCKYKLELAVAEGKYQNCKCCDEYTDVIFNIKFKQTPICESCANTIMMQQMNWLVEKNNAKT